MNAVILAGGLGTRLSEETEIRPKPLVEIGGKPILWHILKHLAHHGIANFHIAVGYKGEQVKRWVLDYQTLSGTMTVDLATGAHRSVRSIREDWRVGLYDTGHASNTGGRVLRLREHLQDGDFLVTYGDGVANVDIGELIARHRQMKCIATITAVRPPARFGSLLFDGDRVVKFAEKEPANEGWINGGFMMLSPKAFDYLSDDSAVLEVDLLERLAAEGQLAAYRHPGFWQCMDTLRDKRHLESLWESGNAPWKVWS